MDDPALIIQVLKLHSQTERRGRDSNPRCQKGTPVFETGSISRSDTSPGLCFYTTPNQPILQEDYSQVALLSVAIDKNPSRSISKKQLAHARARLPRPLCSAMVRRTCRRRMQMPDQLRQRIVPAQSHTQSTSSRIKLHKIRNR